MWRFCSAIHGSANFWKGRPKARLEHFYSPLNIKYIICEPSTILDHLIIAQERLLPEID
jgi:hypothetical protein